MPFTQAPLRALRWLLTVLGIATPTHLPACSERLGRNPELSSDLPECPVPVLAFIPLLFNPSPKRMPSATPPEMPRGSGPWRNQEVARPGGAAHSARLQPGLLYPLPEALSPGSCMQPPSLRASSLRRNPKNPACPHRPRGNPDPWKPRPPPHPAPGTPPTASPPPPAPTPTPASAPLDPRAGPQAAEPAQAPAEPQQTEQGRVLSGLGSARPRRATAAPQSYPHSFGSVAPSAAAPAPAGAPRPAWEAAPRGARPGATAAARRRRHLGTVRGPGEAGGGAARERAGAGRGGRGARQQPAPPLGRRGPEAGLATRGAPRERESAAGRRPRTAPGEHRLRPRGPPGNVVRTPRFFLEQPGREGRDCGAGCLASGRCGPRPRLLPLFLARLAVRVDYHSQGPGKCSSRLLEAWAGEGAVESSDDAGEAAVSGKRVAECKVAARDPLPPWAECAQIRLLTPWIAVEGASDLRSHNPHQPRTCREVYPDTEPSRPAASGGGRGALEME
ncbi:hypothetical protein P7K49_034150 [Saguinus oedipus]|uniref:Basic proline-rich protein-like n=1 Tax=Saguinus oedipus TaxID=9490 RepID=A0ABQ9TTW5_SAGOE|nr:hypothetical protein P7K49_034150 [Saguinus oedipus]